MATSAVLVIDDEYGIRSGIRQILEMEGHQVEEAATGREGLDWLDRRGFDVVLIDYRLPDVDGLTLLQGIRARHADVMTCMITAYANIDTAIAATRQGIDWFLPKPFSPDDLVGVMETLLRHKRLRQEAEELRRAHEASLEALASEKSQTRSLVQCMRDAVLVVNREGAVALVNPAMAALLGRTEAELLRQPASQVLSGPAWAPLLPLMQGPDARRAAFEFELDTRTFLVNVAAFQSDTGQELGRILTLSDTTDIRRAAMEKSRFIRTMVHEFRSPLGAIRSIIDVVLDRSLGDDLGAYAPMLERADIRLQSLVELIGDLLSLSRIDAGVRNSPPLESIAIEPVLAEVCDELKERAASRQIQVACSCEPQLQGSLHVDDLRTIMVNLVGNAIKYNRDGGSVTIRASRQDKGICIEVSDTGLGIRADNLPHLFDEFFREKRNETRSIEGNGLGLSIVKRLVDRCGGTIDVRSTEGEGSTFALHLPA